MAEPQSTPEKMTAGAFLQWAMAQPEGVRHELENGEVIAMAPERARHAVTKGATFRALADAIAKAGRPCQVFPDGMAVRIDAATVYEPDAAVRCGDPLDGDALVYDDPVIVVEVLSPSTAMRDESYKLIGYFRLPSVQHYLLVNPESGSVVHHARQRDGTILTRILSGGDLVLDPPGIQVPVAGLFPQP